jgi:hypothetical protein
MTRTRLIGIVREVQAQPPDEAATTWWDDGPLRFGVEYRMLTPESLRATYEGNDEQWALVQEQSPDGGFFDQGFSVHVKGGSDDWEYLRFDIFVDEPHYHYILRRLPGEGPLLNAVDYDAAANGPMVDWVAERIRHHLPEMLATARADDLSEAVRGVDFDASVERIRRAYREAIAAAASS